MLRFNNELEEASLLVKAKDAMLKEVGRKESLLRINNKKMKRLGRCCQPGTLLQGVKSQLRATVKMQKILQV
jgi:hypothetical protein